jgi:signal transduction histidine kinase
VPTSSKTSLAPDDWLDRENFGVQPCPPPLWAGSVLQAIRQGVIAYDPQGRVYFFNPAAGQITGRQPEQAIGVSIDQIIKLADSPQTLREVLPFPGDTLRLRILDPTGAAQTVSLCVLEPALADPGRPGGVLLLQVESENGSLQELRSNFIASITHEFRTPLSALNASVEFLLDEMAHLSKTEIEELLRSIHMSVSGLQTLIDNLLESSSIEAGMFSIRCQAVDIDEVLGEALQVMQPLLFRRRQEVSLDLVEPRPRLFSDPTRLRQVLVNLLSNASKYGPIGQCIRVQVTQPDSGVLRIAVVDQGPGIRQADRALLFRRFVRIPNQDGPQFGIGLGLSVVKAIVEAHGGQVGVEAPAAGGSIFWFTIPIYGARHARIDRG